MNYGRNPVLRRALEAFFRHRALFLVSVLLITGVVTGSLLLRGRSYVTTAAVYVVPETEVATTLGFTKDEFVSAAQKNVNHFNDLLKDDAPGGFLDTALKAADLRRPISVDPKVRDPRFEMLQRKIFARMDSTEMFTIGLTWDDADECERIVSALQKHYIEDAGQTRQIGTIATVKFLDNQINSYLKRMRDAESVLNRYKQANAGRLPESQSAEIEQLAKLKAERDLLVINSRNAGLRRQALEKRLAEVPKTTILQQTMAGTSIGPKQQILQELQAERARELNAKVPMLPTSTPIRELDAKIARLQGEVGQEVAALRSRDSDNILQKTTQDNPEYLNLTQALTEAKIDQTTTVQKMQAFSKQIAEYEQRVRNFPIAAKELNDRTRDYTLFKAQYEDLRQRREQAQIKADLDKVAATSTLTPIGTVYAKSTATARKMMLMSIAALVTGLAVGVGMIVLGEWLDPTLRYDGDTERFLGVPVLAALPQVGAGALKKTAQTALPPGGGSGGGAPMIAAGAAGGAE